MTIKTKVCTGQHGCGKQKPIGEFYKVPGGWAGTLCKTCRKKYQLSRGNKPTISPQHERDFITECKIRGIVADHGKAFKKYSHVDIVCFGAVRVELKLAQLNEKHPTFKFTVNQRKNGIKADVVVLMLPTKSGYSYHFFKPDYTKFFKRQNGKLKLKTAVLFIDNPGHNRANPKSLSRLDMRQAENKWHWLYPESIRHFVTPTSEAVYTQSVQLELFEEQS